MRKVVIHNHLPARRTQDEVSDWISVPFAKWDKMQVGDKVKVAGRTARILEKRAGLAFVIKVEFVRPTEAA